jgi:hypothetical protein
MAATPRCAAPSQRGRACILWLFLTPRLFGAARPHPNTRAAYPCSTGVTERIWALRQTAGWLALARHAAIGLHWTAVPKPTAARGL